MLALGELPVLDAITGAPVGTLGLISYQLPRLSDYKLNN